MAKIEELLRQFDEENRKLSRYRANGYTNDNDLGTLSGAFGLGAASMANNTLVGGLGYGLANLGRVVE